MGGEVEFLRSSRGARIAYRVQGSGPPLVVVPPWTSHLVVEGAMAGAASFHERLSRRHRLVLYDRWGTGLSDRERADSSLAADVEVLRDVADHLRLRRFALFGPSHGGPVAVAFAHRFPRRVSHLVLYGTRASSLTRGATWAALRELMLADWSVGAQAIATVATRGGDPREIAAFADLLQASASPEMAVALQDAATQEDMLALLGELRLPALVLHRRDDALVSAEDASRIASRIPGARLEMLEGEAHAHVVGDVGAIAERIAEFVAGAGGGPSAQLSAREAEVLELVAQGYTNAEAAERLTLSVRTVERHLLNAYTKLGVRGRAEAAARWLSHEPAPPAA